MKNFITLLLITVAAYANADWIYDADQKTLTSDEFFNADGVSQGRWIFKNVTCDANNGLTVSSSTSHTGPSSPQTLDFSLPITDATGNKYQIVKFTNTTSYNLFGMLVDGTDSTGVGEKVERLTVPETCDYKFANGLWGEYKKCQMIEFKGDYGEIGSEIGSRQMCNCDELKEVKFHFLPPVVYGNSYTFRYLDGDYKLRILYPGFLKTAWRNVAYDYGKYNMELTQDNITKYYKSFPSGPAPTGLAHLNTYAWGGLRMFLAPYDEPTYENKIRIGIMGEPWDLFWAIKDTNNLMDDSLTPKRYGYGVHEFDISNGDSVTIRSPKRYMTYNGTRKICVGYKLHSNPDVIIPWQETYTFDTAGNYGITWVWADNIPGFRISIR